LCRKNGGISPAEMVSRSVFLAPPMVWVPR
jgi:hypothetical protein